MTGLISQVNPGLLLVIIGFLSCLVPIQRVRQAIILAAPVIGLGLLAFAARGVDLAATSVLGFELILYRVDSLSFIFALAFLIASLLNAIYALHTDDRLQDGMSLAYAGAAIAATLSGDLMSLFIFWEITAVTSVFLILRAGTKASYQAAMRYLGVQIFSGVLLLDGLAYVYKSTGTLTMESLGAFDSFDQPGALLIFLAFAIKAAFPFMHNWLQDAYPKATVVGAVVLSAFTTKLAVYAFARLFPGFEILIWIGAVMTVFPVFFAVIENDLRKVLSYSLNNQLGFMICAVGLADLSTKYGQLAMNGAAAHAFAHIIYKGLLFMSMGAVLYRTGTTKASELGGLYKSMPFTAVFCIIGAVSISAFPLFSGFVAKSFTMSAIAHHGAEHAVYLAAWMMLLFASAGVLEHSGIKIPYFTFFSHDSGKRVKEAPFNMLLAMALASFICIAIGLPAFAPGFGYSWLYGMLPFPDAAAGYEPYTLAHTITQMQLLMFAILAFMLLKRFGLYPPERPGTILDTDWLYRRPGFGFVKWTGTVWGKLGPALTSLAGGVASRNFNRLEAAFSPRGTLARGGLTSSMAVWAAVLLGFVMLVILLAQ